MSEKPLAIASYPAVVGAVISALRKSKKMSQAELCEPVGVNTSTWSRIENGESALSIEQLAQAAGVLGIAPSDILKAVEEKIVDLKKLGIEVNITRASTEQIVGTGSLPVSAGALASAIGGITAVAALVSSISDSEHFKLVKNFIKKN